MRISDVYIPVVAALPCLDVESTLPEQALSVTKKKKVLFFIFPTSSVSVSFHVLAGTLTCVSSPGARPRCIAASSLVQHKSVRRREVECQHLLLLPGVVSS